MTDQAVEAFSGVGPLAVGSCAACNLLWFDQSGSISLTPRAALSLFQYIGQASGAAKATLASTFRCPRCAEPLALTHDLQRSTRFTYWRCGNDHGQLFTFNQFLREKNFIRSPSLAELAKLRDTVIETDVQAGVTGVGIDPDGVAKAVHELAIGQASTSPRTEEQNSAAFGNAQPDGSSISSGSANATAIMICSRSGSPPSARLSVECCSPDSDCERAPVSAPLLADRSRLPKDFAGDRLDLRNTVQRIGKGRAVAIGKAEACVADRGPNDRGRVER